MKKLWKFDLTNTFLMSTGEESVFRIYVILAQSMSSFLEKTQAARQGNSLDLDAYDGWPFLYFNRYALVVIEPNHEIKLRSIKQTLILTDFGRRACT